MLILVNNILAISPLTKLRANPGFVVICVGMYL